jgi:hypothetical protein
MYMPALVVVALAAVLALAACSDDDAATAPVDPPAAAPPDPEVGPTPVPELEPPPAPEPAPAEPSPPQQAPADGGVLEFRFDGESCESTVPDTISAGSHDATFENRSDRGSFVGTAGLNEGFTVDEVVAVAGDARPFNTDDPLPEWVDPALVQFPGLIADPASEVQGTVSFSPGTYVFSCVFPDPRDPTSDTGRWMTGGGFVVE